MVWAVGRWVAFVAAVLFLYLRRRERRLRVEALLAQDICAACGGGRLVDSIGRSYWPPMEGSRFPVRQCVNCRTEYRLPRSLVEKRAEETLRRRREREVERIAKEKL
jgi:hypothetical protein